MIIRPATDADVEPLVAMVHEAYRGRLEGWTTETDLLDGARINSVQLREMLGAVHVVTDDEGDLIGCFELEATTDVTAYFGMFVVRPDLQGTGLGRRVLAEAERLADSALGASAVEMTVIAQRSELIAWYERRGYARTGETRPFPYGDDRFGVPRRDDLHFVVLRRALP